MRTKEEKLEYHRKYNKQWYQENKEHKRNYDLKQKPLKQVENLFKCAKARARRLGLDFDIELNDINIPEFCPIMGWKITAIYGKGRIKTNPSLDRIDSSKGYIKGNIWVISDLANRMKQDASIEELQNFAKYYTG